MVKRVVAGLLASLTLFVTVVPAIPAKASKVRYNSGVVEAAMSESVAKQVFGSSFLEAHGGAKVNDAQVAAFGAGNDSSGLISGAGSGSGSVKVLYWTPLDGHDEKDFLLTVYIDSTQETQKAGLAPGIYDIRVKGEGDLYDKDVAEDHPFPLAYVRGKDGTTVSSAYHRIGLADYEGYTSDDSIDNDKIYNLYTKSNLYRVDVANMEDWDKYWWKNRYNYRNILAVLNKICSSYSEEATIYDFSKEDLTIVEILLTLLVGVSAQQTNTTIINISTDAIINKLMSGDSDTPTVFESLRKCLDADGNPLAESAFEFKLESLEDGSTGEYSSGESRVNILSAKALGVEVNDSEIDGFNKVLANTKVYCKENGFTPITQKVYSTKPSGAGEPKLDTKLVEMELATTNFLFSKISTLDARKKELDDKTQQEEASSFINGLVWEDLTPYEKWSAIVVNYVNTGEETLTSIPQADQSKYTLANNGSKLVTDIDLTREQQLKFRVLLMLMVRFTEKNTANPRNPNLMRGEDMLEGTYPYENVPLNKGNQGRNNDSLKNAADALSELKSTNAATISTMTTVVTNFEALCAYVAPMVVGFESSSQDIFEDTSSQGNRVETYDSEVIKCNEYLENILPDLESNMAGFSLNYTYIPGELKSIRELKGTQNAYKYYVELQYLLLIASSYANTDAGLSKVLDADGEETGEYENIALKNYIDVKSTNPANASASQLVLNQTIAYTQIIKGLNYLGVEPFSPQLKAMKKYYDVLLGLGVLNELDTKYVADEGHPLSAFFDVENRAFSYFYNVGVALSASYIPMQTNLYDVNSLRALEDSDFVEKFHYPYGFYRKALYIDTDVNSAVNQYVTGRSGGTRVATLKDLLECEKDVVLYLDNKFYNVKNIADKLGVDYNKLANTETGESLEESKNFFETLGDSLGSALGLNDASIDEVMKTGGYTSYSSVVKSEVTEYNTEEATEDTKYVLSSKKIKEYLTGFSEDPEQKVFNEYTPLQSYAVVSAIYRDSMLYNLIQEQTRTNQPVFVSSPNLAAVKGITRTEWNSIYNYTMLKNLEGNMTIDYKTTLDINSPVYMDVYGNILTESGLVVIPAASNATLQEAKSYNIYTAGYLTLSDNGYYEIPEEYNNAAEFAGGVSSSRGTASGMFKLNEETGTWRVRSKRINSYYINFRDLPISDIDVLKTLITVHEQGLSTNANMKFGQRVNLITEVLRGAPIEFIDKTFEGLDANGEIKAYGVSMAFKLEEVSDTLLSSSNGNSIVQFPNLAFLEGYDVIIMFIYKITFAALILMLVVKIYIDAVNSRLGLKSVGKFILVLVSTVVILYIVPTVIEFSYYATNKALLQDEVNCLAALNLEKRNSGKEIGVTSVREPESKTKLYLKIENVAVPWYDAVVKVLDASAFDTVKQIYNDELQNHIMATLDGVEAKSDGLYMDINTVLDATKVQYDDKKGKLQNITTDIPYASYVTPYYVILDSLVERVNSYYRGEVKPAFVSKVQSKGAVRTYGYVDAFFNSNYFMRESQDVTGLKAVYGVKTTLVENCAFTSEQIDSMKRSLWYSEMAPEALDSTLMKLDEYARKFVVENRDLITKVSDETFLKIMALSVATEHNKLLKVNAARSIEIFDIDTRDIMRLSMADRSTTIGDASKSLARFVYDNSNTMGTVAAVVLVVEYFLMSFLRPVCVLVVLLVVIGSLVVRGLFKHDNKQAVEGFIISTLIICGMNLLYALILKLSMLLPKLAGNTTIALCGQVVLQLVYGLVMVAVMFVLVKDWKSVGFNSYERIFSKVGWRFHGGSKSHRGQDSEGTVASIKATIQNEDKTKRRRHIFGKSRTRGMTGRDILEEMIDRDERG